MTLHSLKALGFAIFATVLGGCDLGTLPEAQSVSMSANNVVVVGKIDLIPRLNVAFEQGTRGMGFFENTVIMATGPAPALVDHNNPGISELDGAIKTQLGTTFFLQSPRRLTFLNDAMIQLGTSYGHGRMWLPGGLFFDVPRNSQAVYIGTLRYTRDTFNGITAVDVIDNYRAANQQFRERFGPNATLTKSLARKLSGG